jgi:hypothetical protein
MDGREVRAVLLYVGWSPSFIILEIPMQPGFQVFSPCPGLDLDGREVLQYVVGIIQRSQYSLVFRSAPPSQVCSFKSGQSFSVGWGPGKFIHSSLQFGCSGLLYLPRSSCRRTAEQSYCMWAGVQASSRDPYSAWFSGLIPLHRSVIGRQRSQDSPVISGMEFNQVHPEIPTAWFSGLLPFPRSAFGRPERSQGGAAVQTSSTYPESAWFSGLLRASPAQVCFWTAD